MPQIQYRCFVCAPHSLPFVRPLDPSVFVAMLPNRHRPTPPPFLPSSFPARSTLTTPTSTGELADAGVAARKGWKCGMGELYILTQLGLGGQSKRREGGRGKPGQEGLRCPCPGGRERRERLASLGPLPAAASERRLSPLHLCVLPSFPHTTFPPLPFPPFTTTHSRVPICPSPSPATSCSRPR